MLALNTVHQQIVDLTELDERSDALGVIAPGDTLRLWLDEAGSTQRELARRCRVSTKHMNDLILGRAPLTPRMALKLEDATGIHARSWCLLETNFRLGLLRGSSLS